MTHTAPHDHRALIARLLRASSLIMEMEIKRLAYPLPDDPREALLLLDDIALAGEHIATLTKVAPSIARQADMTGNQ